MDLVLENRQRRIPLQMRWLRAISRLALAECRAAGTGPLAALPEIEISLVADSTIARVHRDFLGAPGPTDVITFEHGELVVSAETGRRRAGEFGHTAEEEIALYIVHGLLHLNGFDDGTAAEAARMRTVQDRIWRTCRTRLPFPA